jgi:hypothetical protein
MGSQLTATLPSAGPRSDVREIGVTAFGLLFTPAFYTFVRKLGERRRHDPRFSSFLQTEAK